MSTRAWTWLLVVTIWMATGCNTSSDDDTGGDDDVADDDTGDDDAADDDSGDDDNADDDSLIDEACDDDGDYDAKIVRCDGADLAPSELALAGVGAGGTVQGVIGSTSGYGAGPEVYLVGEPLAGVVLVEDVAVEIEGEVPESDAGGALAAAGDVDGDGHEDLVVGDEELGRAYVISGPITADLSLAQATAILVGDAQENAGCAVAGGGSIDGDAFADVAVGAENGDRTYVAYGPLAGEVDLDLAGAVFTGQASSDAGTAVACDGDVDGDGFDDLLVGADRLDHVENSVGGAYLLSGPLSGSYGEGDSTAILVGPEQGAAAGRAVAFTGDLDGDGLDELVIGAPDYDGDKLRVGAAYVVYGPVSGEIELATADVVIVGTSNTGGFGDAVAAAGDVDGDGFGDLLIGAPGGATVFLGPVVGALEPWQADRHLGCQAVAVACGWRVAGGRDLDGDGYDDVLLGTSWSLAPGHSIWRGAVYVHLGGP